MPLSLQEFSELSVVVFGVALNPVALVLGLLIVILVPVLLLMNGNNLRMSTTQNADVSVGLRREQMLSSSKDVSALEKANRVLQPLTFKPFKVLKTTKASHNTVLLRFEIPNNRELGLTVGRHVSVQADVNGAKVIRAYSPISQSDAKGYFELLVKRYELGKISNHMWNLKIGDMLDVRGPVGRFKYKKNAHKQIGLIAGGSGLTPCLQVIRCLLEGPEGEGDDTKFVLFFQNRTEDDILLRSELENLADKYKHRLRVLFFLSNPEDDEWASDFMIRGPKKFQQLAFTGKAKTSSSSSSSSSSSHCKLSGEVPNVRGYINTQAVNALLKPEMCSLVGICGPSGFNEAMKKLCVQEGHDDQSVFVW